VGSDFVVITYGGSCRTEHSTKLYPNKEKSKTSHSPYLSKYNDIVLQGSIQNQNIRVEGHADETKVTSYSMIEKLVTKCVFWEWDIFQIQSKLLDNFESINKTTLDHASRCCTSTFKVNYYWSTG